MSDRRLLAVVFGALALMWVLAVFVSVAKAQTLAETVAADPTTYFCYEPGAHTSTVGTMAAGFDWADSDNAWECTGRSDDIFFDPNADTTFDVVDVPTGWPTTATTSRVIRRSPGYGFFRIDEMDEGSVLTGFPRVVVSFMMMASDDLSGVAVAGDCPGQSGRQKLFQLRTDNNILQLEEKNSGGGTATPTADPAGLCSGPNTTTGQNNPHNDLVMISSNVSGAQMSDCKASTGACWVQVSIESTGGTSLNSATSDLYLKARVTPIATDGTVGTPMESGAVGPYSASAGSIFDEASNASGLNLGAAQYETQNYDGSGNCTLPDDKGSPLWCATNLNGLTGAGEGYLYVTDVLVSRHSAAGETWPDVPCDITGTCGAADTDPPTPNPITGSDIAFSGVTSDEMTITISNVTDAGGSTPISYLFDCVSPGGCAFDSSWQTSNVYNPTGLAPGTTYGWQITTRDSAANTGSASATFSQATPALCGNSVLEDPESCDDGNTTDGDGCSAVCEAEEGYLCFGAGPASCAEVCGNGFKTPSEQCDDGNTAPGDGCSATCTIEAGIYGGVTLSGAVLGP